MSSRHKVVIAGAGPVGCVAAASAARAGAKVHVLEANPKAASRFAGEWLHPPAMRVLRKLGIAPSNSTYPTGEGFVVFPEDGSAPVILPYPDGERGFAWEHAELVRHLRHSISSIDNVRISQHHRLTGLSTGTVSIQPQTGSRVQQEATLVIAADGRRSGTRRLLGIGGVHSVQSRMAGVLLHNAALPNEGYGHVFLGCPGPLLAYRIGENTIRLCLDVPLDARRRPEGPQYLWDAYSPALPEHLRTAFREALRESRIYWAVNEVLPRYYFGSRVGRTQVLLAGDAVGHYHPLTAVGMTLGFGDAMAAGQLPTLAQYRRERGRQTQVAEMLAVVLYEVFSQETADALAIRKAIYSMWRSSPEERYRTMRYLAGEEAATHRFAGSFLRAVTHAARQLIADAPRVDRLPHTRELGRGLAGRLRWLSSGLLPLRRPPKHHGGKAA